LFGLFAFYLSDVLNDHFSVTIYGCNYTMQCFQKIAIGPGSLILLASIVYTIFIVQRAHESLCEKSKDTIRFGSSELTIMSVA
jgi:hypothetical protein